MRRLSAIVSIFVVALLNVTFTAAADVPTAAVEGQPLAANVNRLLHALDYLGHPLPDDVARAMRPLMETEDAAGIQKQLDPQVLFVVSINPELRVKVARGPADSILQQAAYTPVLIKVMNEATVTRPLRMDSPQAGPVYAGPAEGILKRQAQTELKENENADRAHRFLSVDVFDQSPMTERLSGLKVEYVVGLIYSSEAGQREAVMQFDIGQGTQDLGFRSEVPVLFSVQPAVPVPLQIRDFDGRPTTARLEFRDQDGRVYPPQALRLAPDFFFQPQIYRADGDSVLLPPGRLTMTSSRGPEYKVQQREVVVEPDRTQALEVRLERWINPAEFGYYSGDHHIHAAGCSHYDNPTQGVTPADMFAQVKGEGLNVGCVLTWGPCYDHQRQYFSPQAATISEAKTILKYDLEISGFGSAALGHVCLLNLNNQTYPGSEGTSVKGWPSWTVPVLRWAKQQGGVTGYPHSALHVDPVQSARWCLQQWDRNNDQQLNPDEAEPALLAEDFGEVDQDGNGQLTEEELRGSADRAADRLPNLAIPALNGGGAMEIFVSTSAGVCDFISAMDTARIPEWNTWYHLMNCGFPLKLSGETDFPCMSSRRVGQGRVYVHLPELQPDQPIDFAQWCRGIADGRSYVSDGFAHSPRFQVDEQSPGPEPLHLKAGREVTVKATVAFAEEQPKAVAYGTLFPGAGRRMVGDTVNLHAPRNSGRTVGGERLVEIVVNGQVAAQQKVPADGQLHELQFQIPIERSSWVALRQFPQLHTNPVIVQVDGQPIRASRQSARWCAESVRRLWHNRRRFIKVDEQPAARMAYETALEQFQQIAHQSPGSTTVPAMTLE